MRRTQDRKRPKPRNPLKLTRLERQYGGQLKLVAKMVGSIVDNGFRADDLGSATDVVALLRRYADELGAWARNAAGRMIIEASNADAKAWRERSVEMSRALAKELQEAPTGSVYAKLMAEQVELIKSLPLDAAERVHRLATEGLQDGARAAELAKEIFRSGDVAVSRAMLIARTETARAASNLTQARAEYAGSTKYIWRTSGDSDVRSDHRELNGEVFSWSDPPIADQRTKARAHPGCIYNCRCYAEPILPE